MSGPIIAQEKGNVLQVKNPEPLQEKPPSRRENWRELNSRRYALIGPKQSAEGTLAGQGGPIGEGEHPRQGLVSAIQ